MKKHISKRPTCKSGVREANAIGNEAAKYLRKGVAHVEPRHTPTLFRPVQAF